MKDELRQARLLEAWRIAAKRRYETAETLIRLQDSVHTLSERGMAGLIERQALTDAIRHYERASEDERIAYAKLQLN